MQSNVKNEYSRNEYENVNVRYIRKLMSGMLRSFDRCNVRSECGNGGMLGVNVLIGANIWMNVSKGLECNKVLIDENIWKLGNVRNVKKFL